VADDQHAGLQEVVHDRRTAEQEVDPGLLQIVHEGGVVDVALAVHVAPAQRAAIDVWAHAD
jgi:hypothetical protein